MLQMVAANPALQGVHVVMRDFIQQGLPEWILPTFAEMLQNNNPTFGVLQGETLHGILRAPTPCQDAAPP